MKNIFVAICYFVPWLMPATAVSQSSFVSLGPEIAFPITSGLKMNAGTGYGGSFRFETDGSHLGGMITIGYLSFSEKSTSYTTTQVTAHVEVIPIQLGIKYYTQKLETAPKGFFVSAEFGVIVAKTHFTYTGVPDYDVSETGLSLAPGVGYQVGRFEPAMRLQFNVSSSGFNIYYINFRLAYAFLKRQHK